MHDPVDVFVAQVWAVLQGAFLLLIVLVSIAFGQDRRYFGALACNRDGFSVPDTTDAVHELLAGQVYWRLRAFREAGYTRAEVDAMIEVRDVHTPTTVWSPDRQWVRTASVILTPCDADPVPVLVQFTCDDPRPLLSELRDGCFGPAR